MALGRAAPQTTSTSPGSEKGDDVEAYSAIKTCTPILVTLQKPTHLLQDFAVFFNATNFLDFFSALQCVALSSLHRRKRTEASLVACSRPHWIRCLLSVFICSALCYLTCRPCGAGEEPLYTSAYKASLAYSALRLYTRYLHLLGWPKGLETEF